jgi:hypothetical protein
MLTSMSLNSMAQNKLLVALSLLISAAQISTAAQNITVTVANITNKDLTVEISQNRCAKIVRIIKAHNTNNATLTNPPAALTPIKLTCPLEGIIIKGIPTEIWMTVNSSQDLNLLLELDKSTQNIIATYFPAHDFQKWADSRARALRNLDKILAFNADKENLARERHQALESNDKLFQENNAVEYRKLVGFAPDQSIGLKWAHIKIKNQITQEFDRKIAELDALKQNSLEY